MHNGSGDYVIAFSTGYHIPDADTVLDPPVANVANRSESPLFAAVVEATEEDVYESMFQAVLVTGVDGHTREATPLDRVVGICERYRVLDLHDRPPRDHE